MPRNLEAIRKWVALHRPDMVNPLDQIITQGNEAHILLMAVAFESGRMFQACEVSEPTEYINNGEAY